MSDIDVGKTDPIERGLRLADKTKLMSGICWKNRPDRKGIKTQFLQFDLESAGVGKTDPIERGLRRSTISGSSSPVGLEKQTR